MNKSLCTTILLLAAPLIATADSYRNERFGFSLAPPAFADQPVTTPVVEAALFKAPVENGFAANCNIQIQFVDMSPEDFYARSTGQFEQLGWSLDEVSEVRLGEATGRMIRYSGAFNDIPLRFMATAVPGEGRFYVFTCTALAANHDRYEADFRATLESFRLGGPDGD